MTAPREPNLYDDGWSLEDGEQYHKTAPSTFWLPEASVRTGLQVGDYAKLIFRISVDNSDEPEAVERMWVLVRERLPDGGYLGILDNEPDGIAENEEFWLGTELPFSAKHVIQTQARDADSITLAHQKPRRRWV